MIEKKRIGILGGTFDPIHIGHLILAENAYEKFSLEFVYIMPTGDPPHKSDKHITLSRHRSNMVKAAIEDNPHFLYSGFELERDGVIYTSETLSLLTEQNPENEYYFIIGADSLLTIESWKDPEKIFGFSTILAAKREDFIMDNLDMQINHLKKKYGCKIYRLDIPGIGISSTMINDKVKNKESIKYYVPHSVEEYIRKNNLYKE